MSNQHGGPRPKVRANDGRSNNRPTPGPGRKPKSFTLKLGDSFFVWAKDADGNSPNPSMVWTVEAIERQHIDLKSNSGETWRIVR